MAERPHRKLVKCNVLFLGNSVPEESKKGLKALQQPLLRCYPVDHPSEVEGIDAWLTVFTSGILLQLVSDKAPPPDPIWFPIQHLFVAAATKCINYVDGHGRRMETEFADINSQEARASSHPPLFSMIVRKTQGTRVLQCYTFLVRDKEPAVALVDASKHAFLNKSGWSSSHPPDSVIQNELVNVSSSFEAADDVDEFDSVSTAGRRADKPADGSPPSRNVSGSDLPSSASHSRTFPANLVKKYSLTYNSKKTSRPLSPRRQPIPEAFMPRGGFPQQPFTVKSRSRRGEAPSYRGPPIPPQMLGSLRGTVTTRRMRDPVSGASIVETVVQEPVAVPYPVYQPPRIVREVQPIYIPQPPEIREVEVEREVRIPVPVPVYPPFPPEAFYHPNQYAKPHHREKSYKRGGGDKAFRGYEVFDERFGDPSAWDDSPFVNRPDFHSSDPRKNREARQEVRGHEQPAYQGRRRRASSSSSESDDDTRRRYRAAWHNAPPPQPHNDYYNAGVKITELEPDYDLPPNEYDINGNSKQAYEIRRTEREFEQLNVKDKPSRKSKLANYVAEEFRWSQFAEPRETERERGRTARATEDSDGYNITRVKPDKSESAAKKEKKSRRKEKSPSRQPRVSSFEAQVHNDPGAGDVYYKEHTGPQPRNWMDESKEYLNERAFSSALANDAQKYRSERLSAYALNHDAENDTAIDRSMPAMADDSDSNGIGIPAPPPLPEGGIFSSPKQEGVMW